MTSETIISSCTKRAVRWVVSTFGPQSMDVKERCLRFLEEAIEVSQSLELPRDQVHSLVDYVYDRPAGDPLAEIRGASAALLALCHKTSVDFEKGVLLELDRIETDRVRERSKKRAKEKKEAGF